MNKKLRDAVSVVFTYKEKIFVIKRQNFLRTFPGYTAFIGGKVDSDDHGRKNFTHPVLAKHPPYLMQALVREVLEEAGIEIDLLLEQEKIKTIDYLGKAVTPEFNPYRFNTYFFRVELNEKLKFTIDQNEVAQSCWETPLQVLKQWQNGERLMVPPVRYFIQALQENLYVKEPLIFENRFDLAKIVPYIETIHNLIQLMPLSNTVPPASRTNAFIINSDQAVLVDPSPKNNEEFLKFKNSLAQWKIDKVLITHHHKDHHQFAPKLALELNIPLLASSYTLTRMSKVYGKDYLDGIQTTIIADGDEICIWNNEKVLAMSVPGHDQGQIALFPVSKKWFIAGDLFQGIGTVVVGGEEGNMQLYFKTLEKVIALAPACVIPSHGIALGGTHILEKTLEHRKFRERQILEMHQEGLDKEKMLKRIYFDLPEKLIKYALANIDSHLDKLRKEDKI